MKIIDIGSLNVDYVYRVDDFLKPGETKSCRSREVFAGGKGLNQSIALAKAGADVYHAGVIGADGEILRETLSKANVHLDFLQRMEIPGGHTVIQVSDAGQNCILLYGGTNRCLTTELADQVISRCDPSDVILLQNETNLVGYIISKAAERGIRVALNAAPMDSAVAQYPLDKLSWLLVNEVEGAALAGSGSEGEIMDRLSARYPNCAVILTLGSEGVWYRLGGKDIRFGAFPVEDVVDTTAAGDTFIGYFLEAMAGGMEERTALIRASAASALAIQRKGAASSIPFRYEVDGALAGNCLGKLKEIKRK